MNQHKHPPCPLRLCARQRTRGNFPLTPFVFVPANAQGGIFTNELLN